MPLPQPYLPNYDDVISTASSGYQMGNLLRRQNLLRSAGTLAASGNLAGARDALFRGGEIDEAKEFQALIQQADAQKLLRAKQVTDMLGGIALRADTPEKWAAAMDAAARAGHDVSKYRDFSSRDMVLAQAGMAKEALELELKRRQAEAKNTVQSYGGVTNPALASALAKADVKKLQDLRSDAAAAETANQNLDVIETLRRKTDAEGTWRNNALYRFLGRNQMGGFLGIPTSEEMAAIDAMATPAVNVQLSFIEKTKGAISDREMELLGSAVPDARMTDQAAASVLKAMRAANARVQARAEFYDAWLRTYGTGRGADAAWNRFVVENPLITGVDKSGQLVVNEGNIANFEKYFALGPEAGFSAARPQAQPQTAGVDTRPRAVNDQTGQVVIWDGQQWIDAATGEPVTATE